MTVRQGEEHASSGGLADRGRNSGDMVIDIHTLMVDEVFLSGNWHTTEYACTDRPARSHWEHCGDGCSADRWLQRFTSHTGHQEDTDDNYLRHPLRDRSVPARRVQEVRRELGPYYSPMRRTPSGVFSSS